MPPQNPPRPGSSPHLPAIRDEVAPGAVHEYRATESQDQRPTAPPAAPDRRPPPRSSMVGVKVPPLRAPASPVADHDEERTVVGLGPELHPEPPESIRDSREISADVLLRELYEKSEGERLAKAESEELRRQLRALDAAHRAPRVDPVVSLPPKRADWFKMVFGLGGALTLFLGAAGTYLGARAASNEGKVDNVATAASAQKLVVDPLPKQVATVERGTDSCKEWARLYADYDRQIFRKLGVSIPEPENALPVEPIKTRAPVRRANTVTGAPVLEVLTQPPPLP